MPPAAVLSAAAVATKKGLWGAIAAFFAWLADNPGTVSLVWRGKQITTSVVAGFALLLVLLAALWFLWTLLHRIWRSPRAQSVCA